MQDGEQPSGPLTNTKLALTLSAAGATIALPSPTRRTFVGGVAAVGALSMLGAPAVHASSRHRKHLIVGQDQYLYEIQHDWVRLPEPYSWQTTHNVAVDAENCLYVIHEGREELVDHPSIFVFDDKGQFVRAFGSQFQGGGHGVEIRTEGNQQFLYVAAYQQVKAIAKLTLQGEVVWQKFAPMESGAYAVEEDTKPAKVWGRDRFMPTNFAFHPDGGFFLADGYGSWRIHRYDKDGTWMSSFGGEGPGKGTFNTPHGICVDTREGREASLLIADRAHNTVQIFTLDGEYRETLEGFGLPANVDLHAELLVVPELMARLTLLNARNEVVARLGDDSATISEDKEFAIRRDPQRWQQDKWIHPHDACFDADGNIFVAEWVETGRISRLRRI